MSAVLEPQAAAVEVVSEISNSLQTVQASVTNFDKIKAGIAAIEAQHPKALVIDCTTPAGMKQAIAGRAAWRDPRIAVDKARKAAKAPVLELGRAIDGFAAQLTETLSIGEKNYDSQIEAENTRREAVKEAARQAEEARQQRHLDGIAKIRGYADAARRPEMTAERVLNGLGALERMSINDEAWEEFAVQARHVLAETTETVKTIHSELVAKEAEAARLAQQAKDQAERQAELDRIAREQAAAAAALAAQQAEITRQAEALAEQQRTAAAAEEQRQKDSEERAAQQVLKAEPVTADATDRDAPADVSPRGGAMGAGQAAAAAPVGDELIPVAEVIEHDEPPAPAPMIDDGREWKLGEIATLFGVGLTAETVRGLGIEPSRVDKRALLFTTSQVLDLRARLVAHLMSLEVA